MGLKAWIDLASSGPASSVPCASNPSLWPLLFPAPLTLLLCSALKDACPGIRHATTDNSSAREGGSARRDLVVARQGKSKPRARQDKAARDLVVAQATRLLLLLPTVLPQTLAALTTSLDRLQAPGLVQPSLLVLPQYVVSAKPCLHLCLVARFGLV